MKKLDFKGIFPPIVTPFEGEEVAHDKLAGNIEKWGKTGIQGLVVFGSNGEAPYLSHEEKKKVVRTVVEAAPQEMPVIVGTGCESTQATIELTNECARLGADAALIITPYFYGGKMNKAALTLHFTEVADRSEIPILIYNVTKFTHINIDTETVATLSQHPNIVGIKDSSGNVADLGAYLNTVDSQFDVLVGTASSLFSALTLGCSGGVLALANMVPEICVDIYNGLQAGRWEEAKAQQLRMMPVNKAITATYGVAGLKAALDMMGYFGGNPRLPLLPLSNPEKEQLRQILAEAELL